jgi:hypothetical protein
VAAYWEAVRLAGFAAKEAERYFGRPGSIGSAELAAWLDPWPAKRAEARFLAAFKAVTRESMKDAV